MRGLAKEAGSLECVEEASGAPKRGAIAETADKVNSAKVAAVESSDETRAVSVGRYTRCDFASLTIAATSCSQRSSLGGDTIEIGFGSDALSREAVAETADKVNSAEVAAVESSAEARALPVGRYTKCGMTWAGALTGAHSLVIEGHDGDAGDRKSVV